MSERDPRVDPMPGDVLTKNGKEREVDEVYTVKREGIARNAMKYLRVIYVGAEACSPEITLRAWRKWAANAEVVQAGKKEE